MYDDICLKSVSDKPWVKKLFEATPQGRLSTKYKNLTTYIEKLSGFNKLFYSKRSMTLNIISFLTNKPFVYNYKEKSIDEIEGESLSELVNLMDNTLFNKFSNNTKFIKAKSFASTSSFVLSFPALLIQISLRDLCYGIGGIVLAKTSGTKYGYGVYEQILNDESLYQCSLKNVLKLLDDIYYDLEPNETLLNKQNKFTTENRLETFTLKDIETGKDNLFSGRTDGVVNLMGKSKGFLPFIFTNQIITDDKPRTIDNNSKSLIKNLKEMKSKVSEKSLYTVNTKDIKLDEGRTPLSDEEKELRDKQNKEKNRIKVEKKLEKIFQDREYLDYIINTTSNIIDAYIDSIKLANKGIFNQDYKNSTAISTSLQIYQPEILSPYVVAFLEGEWDSLMGSDGKQVFKETFNIKGDHVPAENCLIGYYGGMSEPLCDSYMWIRASEKDEWRRIGISTKGGVNGKGAAASITSIKDFIFKYSGNITSYKKYEDDQWNLTTLGRILKDRYPMEFEVFCILTSISYPKLTENPIPLLKVLNTKKLSKTSTMEDILSYINSNLNMATFIMDCLKSASFEFIQLNATPYTSENGLHYGWKAQYPGVFIGDVEIEPGAGYTKFHIL